MTPPGSAEDLFRAGSSGDPMFTNLCSPSHAWEVRAKGLAERLWARYKEYADPHFLSEIRDHFSERFWEMYLTCTFLENAAERGYSVSCPKPGPDILLELNDDRIWIEAVAATNGQRGKPDSLVEPGPGPNGVYSYRIPEEKIVLRYTNAIGEKYRKYLSYLRKGIVHKNDAYVVAVNKSRLAYRWVSAAADLPRFLKAVYPIGEFELLIDKGAAKIVGTQNRPRFFIPKANRSQVPVQAFVDRRWRGISAVLCSDADVGWSSSPLGSDLELAYNPLGRRPIGRGIIPAAREWWSVLDDTYGELFCAPER
jgi:hypothetical protein